MSNKEYINNVMARSVYRILHDGTVFGEIPGLTGVWANEDSMEHCRQVLAKVLEEWLNLKLQNNEELPLNIESGLWNNDYKDEGNITKRPYKETSGTGV